jgi:hypothetical protein
MVLPLCGVDSAYVLVSWDNAEIGVLVLLGQPFAAKFDHVFSPLEHQLLNCCCASGAVLTEPFPAGSFAVTRQSPKLFALRVCWQTGSPQQLFATYELYPLELVDPLV